MIAGTPEGREGRREYVFRRWHKNHAFYHKTCPNCSVAAGSLDDAAIPYEVIDAEENMELVTRYGVMQGSDFGHRKRREGNETGKCIKYQGVCRKTAEK